jgi:hypothetical protein
MFVIIRRLVAALSVFFAIGITPAAAQKAASWRMTATTGVVRVMQPGGALESGKADMILANGAIITTGANSTAVLENGAQRITVTANSRTTIAPDSTNSMTRILQGVGSALFQVDRRDAPHFKVETPLLAAVVKGTTFTVTAGPDEDLVHVARGLVEVRSNAGQAAQDIPAGQTVRILRSTPDRLSVAAPTPDAVPPLGAEIPPVDAASASGHLVDGPRVAGAAAAAPNSDSTIPSQSVANANLNSRGSVSVTASAFSGGSSATGAIGAAGAINGGGNGKGNSNGNGNSGGGGNNSGGGGGGGGNNGDHHGGGDHEGGGD